MKQHSPGPWTISPSGTHIHADFPHTDPNNGLFNQCGTFIGSVARETDTDLANARLIAAAPELLRLVNALLSGGQFFMSAIEEKEIGGFDFEAWEKDAIQIVAKAEGGEA